MGGRGGAVLLALAATGCATLPDMTVTPTCSAGSRSAVVVKTTDSKGTIVPYIDVALVSENRGTRLRTSTSSLGTARLELPPGSYHVIVGAGDDQRWQGPKKFVRLPRACTLTLDAKLLIRELAPERP